MKVWGRTYKATFGVVDVPAGAEFDMDGLIGWPTVRSNIIQLDCSKLRFRFLRHLPRNISDWNRYPLRGDLGVFAFDVSDTVSSNATIVVDTGSTSGVSLSRGLWNQWTAAHTNRQRTIDAFFTLAGLVIQEESWAGEISLGSINLTNVPVQEATATDISMGRTGYIATLGIYALKRLDIIVDGRNGVIYLQANDTRAQAYRHNRLGAAFSPEDAETSEYMTAHVIGGTPADEAGIRDGDILLRINNLDASKWREFGFPLSSDFSVRKPGTKIKLTLKRGEKEFETEVVLRDLIGPDVKAAK